MPHTCIRCETDLQDGRRKMCLDCASEFRWCNRCKQIKAIDEFYVSRRPGTDGHTRYCRQCHYEHIRRPEAIESQREYHYRYHLQRKFGISKEEADRLARVTVCESCGISKKENRLHVDHCHKTGKIRGVICRNCNYAIGVLEADGRVEAVTAYLARC